MTGERAWTVAILVGFAALAPLPLLTRRDDVLNFVLLVLLSITMAQSWNIIAGYAGQVNLGHAAFFGLGALTARTLWIAGAPILLAMGAGALVAVALALLIGAARQIPHRPNSPRGRTTSTTTKITSPTTSR